VTALITASCIIKIEFYDIDSMNIVWHGNYPKFLERARSELLNIINYNYFEMYASGYTWPVVDLRIKYIKPIALQQEIVVEARLIEFENRLKIDYCIYDKQKKEILSKATSIQVAVKVDNNYLELETPEIFQAKVKEIII